MGRTIAEWYVEEGKKKGFQEGQLRALRDMLRIQLEERFQTIPEALQQQIEATTDLEKLQSYLRQVIHINELQELRL